MDEGHLSAAEPSARHHQQGTRLPRHPVRGPGYCLLCSKAFSGSQTQRKLRKGSAQAKAAPGSRSRPTVGTAALGRCRRPGGCRAGEHRSSDGGEGWPRCWQGFLWLCGSAFGRHLSPAPAAHASPGRQQCDSLGPSACDRHSDVLSPPGAHSLVAHVHARRPRVALAPVVLAHRVPGLALGRVDLKDEVGSVEANCKRGQFSVSVRELPTWVVLAASWAPRCRAGTEVLGAAVSGGSSHIQREPCCFP